MDPRFDNASLSGDDQSGINSEAPLIRIRGLPFTTTKQEIIEFFDGICIRGGEDGIHFTSSNFGANESRPSGEAYIELASFGDANRAHEYHRKNIRNRYIEGIICRE